MAEHNQFVKLTGLDDEPVWIASRNVTAVFENGGHAVVSFGVDSEWHVRESPAEVLALLGAGEAVDLSSVREIVDRLRAETFTNKSNKWVVWLSCEDADKLVSFLDTLTRKD